MINPFTNPFTSKNSLLEHLRNLLGSNKVKLFGQIIFLGLGLLFLIIKIFDNWFIVRDVLVDVEWTNLIAPFSFLLISFLFWPIGMVIFTRNHRQRISYLESARAFFGSQPAKYIPGGLWVVPSRIYLLHKLGFDIGVSSLALLFEISTLIFSSFVVGILFLGVTPIMSLWNRLLSLLILLVCLVCVAILSISPELVSRYWPTNVDKTGVIILIGESSLWARISDFALSSMVYLIMWILSGISFHFLIDAVIPQFDLGQITLSIGVFAFAWFFGYISFFSPGGIGIREGIIMLILSTVISQPYPLIAAIISRLIWLMIELIYFVIALMVARIRFAPQLFTSG